MTVEKQRQIVEEILGTPLPELAEVYYRGAQVYNHMTPNTFITPYLMSQVYTEHQMAMVIEMPGSAAQIAEKLGLDPVKTEEELTDMELRGLILGSNVQVPRIFGPHANSIAFRDSIGTGRLTYKEDWKPHLKEYALMEKWRMFDYSPEAAERIKWEMRVIPKWESIKDIPGVMYCENMREIMERNLEAGTFFTALCVCRAYKSYLTTGEYSADFCQSGLHEHGGYDGHCYSFNRQAEFFSKKHDTYHPNREEMEKRLYEADHSTAIYTTPDTRDTTYVCTCCTDCCAIQDYEQIGFLDVRRPSRFRPTVLEDKCLGCGLCSERCNYKAIEVVDGVAKVYDDKCKGCGCCVVECPGKALKMKIVHGPEWIPEVPYVDGWSIHDELEEKK